MKSILIQYHKRIIALEGEKYDLEYEVAKKDFEVEKFSMHKKKQTDDAAINQYEKRRPRTEQFLLFSLSSFLPCYHFVFFFVDFCSESFLLISTQRRFASSALIIIHFFLFSSRS